MLPGPDDTWGGTWSTSGWRTHDANILFGIKKLPKHGKWKLVVDLVDANPSRSVVKVMVNSAEKKFEIKGIRKEYWRVIFKMPRNKFLNFQFQPMI